MTFEVGLYSVWNFYDEELMFLQVIHGERAVSGRERQRERERERRGDREPMNAVTLSASATANYLSG